MEHETGVELFARLTKHSSTPSLPTVVYGDGSATGVGIIEITGINNSGKTTILMDAVARHLLHAAQQSPRLRVVLIDLEKQMNAPRLRRILSRLAQDQNCGSPDAVANTAYSQLEMVCCYSLADFLLALHHVESTVLQKPTSAVFVDGLSSFYWYTRRRYHRFTVQQNDVYARLGRRISIVNRLYKVPFFVTRQSPFRYLKNFRTGQPMDFMGTSWQKIPSLRILTKMTYEGNVILLKICSTSDNGYWFAKMIVTADGVEYVPQ